jgi:hypothetical protein
MASIYCHSQVNEKSYIKMIEVEVEPGEYRWTELIFRAALFHSMASLYCHSQVNAKYSIKLIESNIAKCTRLRACALLGNCTRAVHVSNARAISEILHMARTCATSVQRHTWYTWDHVAVY